MAGPAQQRAHKLEGVEITPAGDGCLHIAGELSFATVPGLLAESGELFEGSSTFVVDLEGVQRADSAGLALLLEWLKRCRKREQDLFFRNLPPSLTDIARVSNLEELFERLGR